MKICMIVFFFGKYRAIALRNKRSSTNRGAKPITMLAQEIKIQKRDNIMGRGNKMTISTITSSSKPS